MSADECPWCQYNNYGCTVEDCDFKSLPYEKEAILNRLIVERKKVDKVLKRFKESKEKEISDALKDDIIWMLDVTKGMQIMVDRLVADFGMVEKEIHKFVGFNDSKMSFVEKARLLLKLRSLKNARRGK